MGLIRNLIKEVTGSSSTSQQSSQSTQSRTQSCRMSESDNDSGMQATNSSGRSRTSDSGRSSPGLVRGTIKFATDKISGAKPPQYRQDRVDGEHVATAEDVAKALELVTSACSDLQEALDGLKKRGGVIGAVKVAASNISSSPAPAASTGAATSSSTAGKTTTYAKQTSLPAPGAKGSSTPEGEEAVAGAPSTSGWAKTGEVLKTVGHDGRIPAQKLILEAHNKYEAAADLVDGMPEIDMAESNAPALGKLAAPLGAAGQITMMAVGVGSATFGIISRVVKKKRTKKATNSVEGMLAEYTEVRQQLERLNRSGRGGMLGAAYSGAVAVPLVQQYSSRPPMPPPQAPSRNAGGTATAPAVGVPIGGAPTQYGYAPPAQQYPQQQYGAAPPHQQYGAPPPQQYQQQQYGVPPPQQYQQQQYYAASPQYQQQQYSAAPPQQYQQQQYYGAPPQQYPAQQQYYGVPQQQYQQQQNHNLIDL